MSGKRPVSTIDALLAATAKVHKMTLATRNITDIADLGATVLTRSSRTLDGPHHLAPAGP